LHFFSAVFFLFARGRNFMQSSAEITGLLIDWSDGDELALEKLMPLVEKELRRLADGYMRRMRPGDTLQTTAVINETYLRIINQNRVRWQNRAHFFGIAAYLMRGFLLNYLRDGRCGKRGGRDNIRVSLSQANLVSPEKTDTILALEAALCKLARIDARKAKVVELKFYGGMESGEIAEFLKVSGTTVARDWNMAKAWLAREIGNG
jgi:RNA polymerase sigma-70 factor (ECF subfamily)